MAMKRTSLTAPLALWLALIVPQGAVAAGGPVAPVQGSYIGVPGSPYRYAAFDARGNTVVKWQEAGAGPAVSELRVSGRYGIPGVDYSGSTTASRQTAVPWYSRSFLETARFAGRAYSCSIQHPWPSGPDSRCRVGQRSTRSRQAVGGYT
jgi:hypothetical protein